MIPPRREFFSTICLRFQATAFRPVHVRHWKNIVPICQAVMLAIVTTRSFAALPRSMFSRDGACCASCQTASPDAGLRTRTFSSPVSPMERLRIVTLSSEPSSRTRGRMRSGRHASIRTGNAPSVAASRSSSNLARRLASGYFPTSSTFTTAPDASIALSDSVRAAREFAVRYQTPGHASATVTGTPAQASSKSLASLRSKLPSSSAAEPTKRATPPSFVRRVDAASRSKYGRASASVRTKRSYSSTGSGAECEYQ